VRERKGLWIENTSTYAKKRLILTVSTPEGELQALPANCPISAQTGLLITNHVPEFCYSFHYTGNIIEKIRLTDTAFFQIRVEPARRCLTQNIHF